MKSNFSFLTGFVFGITAGKHLCAQEYNKRSDVFGIIETPTHYIEFGLDSLILILFSIGFLLGIIATIIALWITKSFYNPQLWLPL